MFVTWQPSRYTYTGRMLGQILPLSVMDCKHASAEHSRVSISMRPQVFLLSLMTDGHPQCAKATRYPPIHLNRSPTSHHPLQAPAVPDLP